MAILGFIFRIWIFARYVFYSKCKRVLKDIIKESNIEKNRMYSISEFIDILSPKANIIISDPASKKFNYGVSNGFRTLQDIGFLKMEHILDQEDIWVLYPMKAYSNDSIITNITIL